MTAKTNIKLIINMPDRHLFSYLQKNMLYQDVEMFYFPNLMEIHQFIQRINPQIVVTHVDRGILASKMGAELFKTGQLKNTWMVLILSSGITIQQVEEFVDLKRSMVFSEGTKPEIIAHNLKTLLKEEKSDLSLKTDRELIENLLTCSIIINEEKTVGSIFERLTNYLPKILPYDYWAIFTADPELRKVNEFKQFVPPHRRNIAVLTPNLEKLAEIWLKKQESFHVKISEDPQLFRKLGEWGWGIKQLHFFPLLVQKVPIGGIILGSMSLADTSKYVWELLTDISGQLAKKIHGLIWQEKGRPGLDEFAEQLIYNRFSEDSLIQLSCRQINEVSRGDNTIFWQINRGFGFLFPKFSYASENKANWRSLEKNMLFWTNDKELNQLISNNKLSLLENVDGNSHFSEATVKIFQGLGYHHLLVAPVRIQNEEMGVFIANRGGSEPGFGAWEMERVAGLMDKISKVLEDTFVVKEANLKLKQLSRIFELGNEIKLDLNLEDILARIMRSVRRTLGWNDVVVLRGENFRKFYEPIGKIGFDKKVSEPLDILNNVGFEKFEKFLLNCKKIRNSFFYDSFPLSENGNGTGFLDEVATGWHDQDLLSVPIETGKKKLGFLVVRDPVDRMKPNEDKITSLEYFANQAAVAVENSMLYENLLASEERYRSLAETMTLALVTCSPDSNIVYLNPAFEALVGRNKKALIKRPISNFFARDSQDNLQDIAKSIMDASERDGKNIENVELEVISADGETIPVSTFAFPFYQQRQKIGFFLVLSDLRVVKKLERLKADFNSMIVHDLRSPMNVIQGFIELIRTRVVGEINGEQEELLDIAKENVKKVLTLVDNFLVASKIEVGKFSVDPKVSEINGLIQRVLENHQVLLKNKSITSEFARNENLPLLFFDSFRIEQVLTNFLSNAVKFTPEGGKIRVTTDFFQKTMKGEEKMFARIGVHDNGPGIPSEKMKYVFEKYEQVDSEISLKSAGTGLGLSICREIVSLHGGDIWVESELKKGSHFYFTLPIEPSIEKFLK